VHYNCSLHLFQFLPDCIFLPPFPTKILYTIVLYSMPCANRIALNSRHRTQINWRVQIMNLFIVQFFFKTYCHSFFPFGSKFLSQHTAHFALSKKREESYYCPRGSTDATRVKLSPLWWIDCDVPSTPPPPSHPLPFQHTNPSTRCFCFPSCWLIHTVKTYRGCILFYTEY
jgi:hypothetical protein